MTAPATDRFLGQPSWLEANRGAAFLVPLVLVLFVLPSNVVLNVAGGAGSPSRLGGQLALALVLIAWFRPGRDRTASVDPGVVVLVLYMTAILILYAVAQFRLLEESEATGAPRALLTTAAFIGIGLFAATQLQSRREVGAVAAAVVAGAAVSAIVGIIQSRVPWDYASTVLLPGSSIKYAYPLEDRSSFVRVLGTTISPIEYAVVLGAVAPLALHFATYTTAPRRRRWAILGAVLVIGGMPFGVSRSGVVALVVALLVYAVTWTGKRRITAAVIAFLALAAFRVVQPGLLGTLQGLFTNASDDSSVQARTDDYPPIFALVDGSPWVGRGIGTFRPDAYFFLDNQWLMNLVEGGVLGVAALLMLTIGGLLLAQGARRRNTDPEARSLCQAVLAGILALAICGLTFDLFSFQQAAMLFGLLIGLASALRRIAFRENPEALPSKRRTAAASAPRPATTHPQPASPAVVERPVARPQPAPSAPSTADRTRPRSPSGA